MYLLKPAVRITQSQSLTFTFHYVSIKTYLNYSLYNHHYYLHSTMYLLKLVCRAGQTNTWKDLHSTMYLLKPSLHLVSYKSYFYLHSTMYLLKRGQHRRHIQSHMYLHSTMYLLKPVSVKYPIKTFWIYIPLCIY